MVQIKQQLLNNGTSFLDYFLYHYVGIASQIVCSTQAKIDRLNNKMTKGSHWDMGNFTTCVSIILVTLTENGGKDNLVFEKVYKVLTHPPCQLFNSETVVYKQVHFSSPNIHTLLVKVRGIPSACDKQSVDYQDRMTK